MNERGETWHFTAMIVTSMIFSAGILLLLADDGEAFGSPSVTLEIYQDDAYVKMERDSSGTVLLNGSVTVLVPWSPDIQAVEIMLDVMTEGLLANFDPQVLIFWPDEERTQYFDLEISVPLTFEAGSNIVEIGGRWKYTPGTLGGTFEEEILELTVEEVDDGEINGPSKIIIDEEDSIFPITLQNTGNVDQFYEVRVGGSREMERAGMEMSLEDGGITKVYRNEEKDLDLIFRCQDPPMEGKYNVEFSLYGLDSGLKYDSISMSIEISVPDEQKIIPSIIDDDDNKDPSDDDDDTPVSPSDDDDDDNTSDNGEPPDVNTSDGDGFSIGLIIWVMIVIVLGVGGVGGFVYFTDDRKKKK